MSTHYGNVTHSSAGLGQLQGDAIRPIQGGAGLFDDYMLSDSGTGNTRTSGAFYVVSWAGIDLKTQWNDNNSGYVYFDASRVTPVEQEIRPVNRSVRYLIRAR